MPKPSITLAIMACLGVALPASPERCARASRRLARAWSLVTAAVVASLGTAFALGPSTSIPYTDDFEGYTNLTPLIDGTNGWYGSSAEIIVVSNTEFAAAGSTNSAMIPVDCTLSNRFESIPSSNVWVQMDLQPSLFDGTNCPEVNTNQAALFYVNSNGNFVVHNGPASPDPTNSANWVTLTNFNVGTEGTNWVAVGIYEDFTMQKWHLYASTNTPTSFTLVTNNIKFVNPGVTNFTGFESYNGATTSYLDNVSVMYSNKTVFSVTGGWFMVSNKVYDATATAAITNKNLMLDTNGTEGLTLMAVAAFTNKDVSMNKIVHLTDLWLEGADAAKYTLSLTNALTLTSTGDVTQASLAAALVSTITKTYNGNTAATNLVPANYSLSGLVGSETCTVSQTTGTYASADADTGIQVVAPLVSTNFVDSTGSGFDTNNYALPTAATGTVGVITKATSLAVTLAPTISKVYDRLTTATLGITNYSLTGFVGSETCTVNQTVGAYATTNVGTGIRVTATLASNNFDGTLGFNTTNYSLPTTVTGNVGVITASNLIISGTFQACNKGCDGTTAATITNSSLALDTVKTPDVVTLNSNAMFDSPNVGTWTVRLTGSSLAGADAGNYTLDTTSPTTTADITTNSQTISFPAIPAQPLTNVSLTLSATASSGLPVTFTVVSGPGTILGDVITFNAVGANTVRASQAGDSNFYAAVDVTNTFPVYDSTAAPTTNTIPFTDTFEDYLNLVPLVNGTNGWYGSSLDIIVQGAVKRSGSRAAMIPFDCTLTNRFQSKPPTNVWVQMDLRPSLYDSSIAPRVDTNAAWLFYFSSNGNFVVHNGPTTNASVSTNWVETTNGCVGTNGTNWVTVGIYIDFTKTNWDLYANGVVVTNAIGFVNTNLTNFAGFEIYNGSQTTYLDNVYVRAPGTVMVSPTNLHCQVMQGVAASNTTFAITAQTGVWDFTNTVSAAWLTVSPPSGSVSAGIGWTNTVICGTPADGSYTGTVTVSATSVADAYGVVVPRTRTVTVTLDVMDLQVAETNLAMTNGFMYSNNLAIPSQTFSVWNAHAGGDTFNYTVERQGAMTNWYGLSTNGGVAGSNTVTVQYTTNVPGDYTGTIKVSSSEGGGATSYVYLAAQIVARPEIELSSSMLTQTVYKGAPLVSQTFTVRNKSGAPIVPMQYTLTKSNGLPALIQSLSSTGSVSSGEANSVQVNYMDASGMESGIYTAMVQVAAWDAGTTYAPVGSVLLSTTLVVRVELVSLSAPSGVTATDGTYTNKVVVSWDPLVDAANYNVYRSLTFDVTDLTQVEPIGNSDGTNTIFNDETGLAGVRYYYWVSSVNAYRSEGPKSTKQETGYRGLAAPGGIFATDGAYLNKVRVTWPLVDGATGYQLYRGLEGDTTLAPIYFTAGGVYEDTDVDAGVHYQYKVGATNGIFGSTKSIAEIGYAFGAPGSLSASKSAYVGKVRLTWDAVESASGYQVWRGSHAILPPDGGAVKLATVTSPTYDDTSVSAGVTYYYWVRGYSLAVPGCGDWSGMASGNGAAAGVDLWVDDLVVLPVQVGVGDSPAIVSFRMGNRGGTNMVGANGTVKMEFATNQVFGTGDKIGEVVEQVTLGVGQDMVMKVAGNQLVAPATEGDYNIFVRVLPESPSLLADTNPGDNVAQRTGVLRVRSTGLNYQVFNDYDGDGMSDLGVYRGMRWSIRSVDGHVMCAEAKVFDGAGRPVLGDLDGDRRSDPMVFDSASRRWQILLSGSGYRLLGGGFGRGDGDTALVADYEGVGREGAGHMLNLSVVSEGSGRWMVLKAGGVLTEWNWGAPGYEPVIGDYDGDGCWDMAVYQETTGLWYIRTLNGQMLVVGAGLGGSEYSPVPGDYDGDGCWDVAIYGRTTGRWFIYSLAHRIFLGWGILWGAPGLEPVMGDYDGDGKWDMGLYQETTGLWFVGSLDGRILAYASFWGGPGYRPIGN